MRIENGSFVVVLETPRGEGCAVESRNRRLVCGVATGTKLFLRVLGGSWGEKVLAGLFVMEDARNMFRAAEMELVLRLLDGKSSRLKVFRADDAWGVPVRPFGVDVNS